MSVPERSLHFGPRTSITTPLRSKGLGFGLSCSCTLKYASSRGRGNVVIPKGFPRSVGRVESQEAGFPPFPYSVISKACFGKAFHKVKITAKARFGNRNHLNKVASQRRSRQCVITKFTWRGSCVRRKANNIWSCNGALSSGVAHSGSDNSLIARTIVLSKSRKTF